MIAPILLRALLLVVPIVLPPLLELDHMKKQTQIRIAYGVNVVVFTIVVIVLLVLFKQ